MRAPAPLGVMLAALACLCAASAGRAQERGLPDLPPSGPAPSSTAAVPPGPDPRPYLDLLESPRPSTAEVGTAPAETRGDDRSGDRPTPIRFDFTRGFSGQSRDGDFICHVGGRIDWDSGWFRTPPGIQDYLAPDPLRDGTALRRLRLLAEGAMWENVEFRVEADFSRGTDIKTFRDDPQAAIFLTHAWIALHDLPVLDVVRLGHQKEFLSFANAGSGNVQPFLERPYAFDAFQDNFSYDLGVSTNRTYCDQAVTSWAGVFWNGTRSQAFNVSGGYAGSGRLTWMPVCDEPGQRWLNLGVAGSLRSLGLNSPNSVTVRPLVRTGKASQVPNLIDSIDLLSRDGLAVAGTGAHSAWGPLTFGAEALAWSISDATTGALADPDGTLPPGALPLGGLFFWGWSVEALYFLTTGDHRGVVRDLPGYDRVRPVRNFLWTKNGCRGPGAWEVGVRYDHVDVNSGPVRAGTLDSVTLGLNWYLNPNTRISTNYVYTFLGAPVASARDSFHALGARVHFDF